MTAPATAVWLRRSRRSPSANGDSVRVADAGNATTAPRGSSASWRLPPLMGLVMASSRVPDPWIEEGVGEIDQEIDDHEGEGGDEGEPLHLLVVARDDGVDPEGAEPGHGEECLHHDGAADE